MSRAGRLTLNSELLARPRSAAEYVIVLELVHLLAPNRDKVFKSFMSAYLPDWEERQLQKQPATGVTPEWTQGLVLSCLAGWFSGDSSSVCFT
jgi:hypothetical protein